MEDLETIEIICPKCKGEKEYDCLLCNKHRMVECECEECNNKHTYECSCNKNRKRKTFCDTCKNTGKIKVEKSLMIKEA